MKVKEIPGALWREWQVRWRGVPRDPRPPEAEVIVSLTSIPSRLSVVPLTVLSVLQGTVQPEKIVLWLNDELKGSLPRRLANLERRIERFEIRYSPLNCSHRKLVHSLEAFPGKNIVTCDDDSLYAPDWLENLVADHQEFPNDVIGNRVRQIRTDAQGELLPYKQWTYATDPGSTAGNYMPTGYGGVLYPPRCLHADVTDAEQYLALTPTADDLWFKAMSWLEGTESRLATDPGDKPITMLRSQSVALLKSNVREDRNRSQWSSLIEQYPALSGVAHNSDDL